MRRLLFVSSAMGLAAVAQSFGLLLIGMEWLSKQLDYQGNVVIIEGIPTPINTSIVGLIRGKVSRRDTRSDIKGIPGTHA